MIVSTVRFADVCAHLSEQKILSVDTETTGLKVWHNDRLFSIIFSDGKDAFYFNFQKYSDEPECLPEFVLPREWIKDLKLIFDDPEKLFFAHNAKFDMGMLDKEGLEIKGTIHCTQVGARVEYNDHLTYDLNDCLARIGDKKDDAVEKYIEEHHLWKWELIPGKKTKKKIKFFYQVPFKVIVPYGEQDALGTFKLGMHQIAEIEKISNQNNTAIRPLKNIMNVERRLTKTCYGMEKFGVAIDVNYCQQAIAHEEARYQKAAREFERLTGITFVDSGKTLAEAFTKMGEEFPTTSKGNPSFTEEVLEAYDSPVAKLVQEYRDAYKRCNTYFRSFLYYSDKEGFIHPNMWQDGAKTGRFSYSDPNFQNLTKEEDLKNPFPVRRAIIPYGDYILASVDWDQQEFRMMLDYAGELPLIKKIMEGYDPHQATADLAGCGRRPAKILNFGLLYGMGLVKLAFSILDLSSEEKAALRAYDALPYNKKMDAASFMEAAQWNLAKENLKKVRGFKEQYFQALPKVKEFIKVATQTAEQRGFVFTWAGRRLHFPDPKFAYRAANGIIQGGASDCIKGAMNQIDDLLQGYKSKQVLAVHDEIVFLLHKSELDLISEVQKIMTTVYPHRHIPLTCSPSYSLKSWADMTEGEFGQETGNKLQGQQGEALSQKLA